MQQATLFTTQDFAQEIIKRRPSPVRMACYQVGATPADDVMMDTFIIPTPVAFENVWVGQTGFMDYLDKPGYYVSMSDIVS